MGAGQPSQGTAPGRPCVPSPPSRANSRAQPPPRVLLEDTATQLASHRSASAALNADRRELILLSLFHIPSWALEHLPRAHAFILGHMCSLERAAMHTDGHRMADVTSTAALHAPHCYFAFLTFGVLLKPWPG